jgi:uncharacterized protein involved in exopolysaccharide biosynthesis
MAKEIETKNFGYDVFDLIKYTWGKRRILISITFIAFVLSIIISLMIKPRFKSTVIMFPSATVPISKSLVETGAGSSNEKDILTFGEDEDAERLLQILRSDQLTDHIIEKFDLIKYYGIDTSSKKFPRTMIKGILGSNIKCRRTEYNSIEINVFDSDPQMAADIANEIACYSDTIIFKVIIKRAKEAYNVVMREYDATQLHINNITDSLTKIRSYGITDYPAQSMALTRAYGKAVLKRDSEAIKILESKMEILQKYGSKYVEFTMRLQYEVTRLSLFEAKVAAAKVIIDPEISNIFIVDKAIKAEKKASPKRAIIVILSSMSAFALSLFILLLIERSKTRI